MYQNSLAVIIQFFFFSVKNTNFKNYKIFTGDYYYSVLLSLKSWPSTFEFSWSYKQRKIYLYMRPVSITIFTHISDMDSKKSLVDAAFYFVTKISNRYSFFLVTCLNTNVIITQCIAWTKQKYVKCIQCIKCK